MNPQTQTAQRTGKEKEVSQEATAFKPNATVTFDEKLSLNDLGWVSGNTAIMVVHGIGNQFPLESIDQFGRGLIKSLKAVFKSSLKVSHHVVPKDDGNGSYWMDNFLRLEVEGQPNVIDLYEYYWAHYTEDKANWTDLNAWLHGVVRGAKTFYKRNAQLGHAYKDQSIFFYDKSGKFNVFAYWFFISFVSKIFLMVDGLMQGILWLIERIPLFGSLGKWLIDKYAGTLMSRFTNVVGDVVVYNVIDPKHRFYETRKKILDGAVKALRHLIEKTEGKEMAPEGAKLFYESVIVGGHSLGSQVAYDAINRLNLLMNQGKINHYDNRGRCTLSYRKGWKIESQLRGFFTFGSPLDKIVFFLRENVSNEQYVRQQLLSHFHGFKQREFNFPEKLRSSGDYTSIINTLERFLDDIQWRNYFDNDDYVSGGLDYYERLTNIDCKFGKGLFTHSNYWDSRAFYDDVIYHFMLRPPATSDDVEGALADIASQKNM
jgi:hypothetical protein